MKTFSDWELMRRCRQQSQTILTSTTGLECGSRAGQPSPDGEPAGQTVYSCYTGRDMVVGVVGLLPPGPAVQTGESPAPRISRPPHHKSPLQAVTSL